MKYIIARKFAFNYDKLQITRDAKAFCTGKVTPSKEYIGRYNIKLSNPINKYIGETSCLVQPDPKQLRSYLIYLRNDEDRSKTLSAQFTYQLCGQNNYLYTILFDSKIYKVRSCDLKDRCLTLLDIVESEHSSTMNYQKTVFQVSDLFTKTNTKYHVTINDKKWQYVYLAMTILLDLHECRR